MLIEHCFNDDFLQNTNVFLFFLFFFFHKQRHLNMTMYLCIVPLFCCIVLSFPDFFFVFVFVYNVFLENSCLHWGIVGVGTGSWVSNFIFEANQCTWHPDLSIVHALPWYNYMTRVYSNNNTVVMLVYRRMNGFHLSIHLLLLTAIHCAHSLILSLQNNASAHKNIKPLNYIKHLEPGQRAKENTKLYPSKSRTSFCVL